MEPNPAEVGPQAEFSPADAFAVLILRRLRQGENVILVNPRRYPWRQLPKK